VIVRKGTNKVALPIPCAEKMMHLITSARRQEHSGFCGDYERMTRTCTYNLFNATRTRCCPSLLPPHVVLLLSCPTHIAIAPHHPAPARPPVLCRVSPRFALLALIEPPEPATLSPPQRAPVARIASHGVRLETTISSTTPKAKNGQRTGRTPGSRVQQHRNEVTVG